MALMAFGVSVGFACSIAAMVPLTTGAAMLVPLRLRYGNAGAGTDPGRSAAARLSYRLLPGTASDTVPTPGATRSGFAAQSRYVGPRELNDAIVSSSRLVVPMVLDAPTVSTQGALPGAPIPPYCRTPCASRPRFPAAETTTIPASTRRFAANVNGSVQYDSYMAEPTDRLTTRMLYRV